MAQSSHQWGGQRLSGAHRIEQMGGYLINPPPGRTYRKQRSWLPRVRRVLDPGATMRPAPSPGNTPITPPKKSRNHGTARVGPLDVGRLSSPPRSPGPGGLDPSRPGLRRSVLLAAVKARVNKSAPTRRVRMGYIVFRRPSTTYHKAGGRRFHGGPPSPRGPARGPSTHKRLRLHRHLSITTTTRLFHSVSISLYRSRATRTHHFGRMIRAVRATPAHRPWRSCPSVHALPGVRGGWWGRGKRERARSAVDIRPEADRPAASAYSSEQPFRLTSRSLAYTRSSIENKNGNAAMEPWKEHGRGRCKEHPRIKCINVGLRHNLLIWRHR